MLGSDCRSAGCTRPRRSGRQEEGPPRCQHRLWRIDCPSSCVDQAFRLLSAPVYTQPRYRGVGGGKGRNDCSSAVSRRPSLISPAIQQFTVAVQYVLCMYTWHWDAGAKTNQCILVPRNSFFAGRSWPITAAPWECWLWASRAPGGGMRCGMYCPPLVASPWRGVPRTSPHGSWMRFCRLLPRKGVWESEGPGSGRVDCLIDRSIRPAASLCRSI